MMIFHPRNETVIPTVCCLLSYLSYLVETTSQMSIALKPSFCMFFFCVFLPPVDRQAGIQLGSQWWCMIFAPMRVSKNQYVPRSTTGEPRALSCKKTGHSSLEVPARVGASPPQCCSKQGIFTKVDVVYHGLSWSIRLLQ